MHKKKWLLLAVALMSILSCKKVYAFTADNYRTKSLCGTFEVAGFHNDGVIDPVACYNTYNEAKDFMTTDGASDLAILTKVNGQTKIIDANKSLVDLSVKGGALTYYYTSSDLKYQFTYMANSSSYGAVDAGLVEVAYSSKGVWTAKVRIGGYTGWLSQDDYEIVPITWIKSYSSYTVSDDSIRHNYVTKIQNEYQSAGGSTIGPKPEMLSPGTYYSYDGHYFYDTIEKLVIDYRNNNHNNAVNKDKPYYNYYMYLSNHTKTAYSSVNIDEYIRNNLGYTKDVYGHTASTGTSRLYGSGTFFYYAQEKYGVNAILSLSLSRNETGNGRSNLAVNKNNGFGLNAVDSNPFNSANWYATFGSSILGYASKWITYGYGHPSDWRYYGPQFGDKSNGMNVKYASDTYWSEKMAANYYSLDKAFGLQDYNFYQLGVVKQSTQAYSTPSTSGKKVYVYPEADDGVVIVDEVTSGGITWYKVISDLNIDSNYNEVTSGNYNWDRYVYIKAADVTKINTAKNGYVTPSDITEYQNSKYEYDLFIENTEFKPKVGISTKDTPYYYDSSLTSKRGATLLKDRYVIVYAVATLNNQPVSYLVTYDYTESQKEWVSADSIKLTDTPYGHVTIDATQNMSTWITYNTVDDINNMIGSLYTYAYIPILDSLVVNGETWYKVPVSLTTNTNVYGYTLAQFSDFVRIDVSTPVAKNYAPVISATDKTIYTGQTFDPKAGVTAWDNEDGDLTSRIEVIENTVNVSKAGTYKVTYKVVDNDTQETRLTITVTVKENEAPVINASDKVITENSSFDPKAGVTATDAEDGDLTSKIVVKQNTVNTSKIGTYKVVYEVTDSLGKTTTKEIKVEVKAKKMDQEDGFDFEEVFGKLKDGEFSLEELSYNKTTKKFLISGYLIILGENNVGKEYGLILINKNNEDDVHLIEINSWTSNTPFNLGTGYSEAWFKGEIDFTGIPNGDYELYMIAATDNAFTLQVVDNFFNLDIARRGEDANHGYNFKVNQKSQAKEIELSIRDHLYTTSEAPTSRNMVNGYEEVTFRNNKLYLYGYSYDYSGTYNNGLTITRKLILENNETFKQNVYDLGSVKGPFTITTQDNKDKSYAWFEKEIDISNLEKGTYTLLIYTKSSDAENYDEIEDMFRMINETVKIGSKTYHIYYNKDRNTRIEIEVK